jgi:hypothetical protein
MAGTRLTLGRWWLGLAPFLPAACLVGCSESGPPSGTISGKVIYQGKPVSGAVVNFYSPKEGLGVSAVLDASGAYTIQNPLRAGKYGVYISTPPAVPGPTGVQPPPPPPDIPVRYLNQSTSDLTVEVTSGRNTKNFDLQP